MIMFKTFCDICGYEKCEVIGYTDIFGHVHEACGSCRRDLEEDDAAQLLDEANAREREYLKNDIL